MDEKIKDQEALLMKDSKDENPMNYVYGLIGVLVASAVYYIYIVLICKNKVLE